MAPLPSGRTISYFPIRPESSRTTGLDSLWSLMGGRGRARAPALSAGGLARDRELGPAVALPAALVRFVADLDLLAVGDRLQPVGGHPEGHDVVVGALGAPLPEREVVLDGPALVAVPFDRDPEEVESLEHFRVLAEDRPVALAEVGLVVVEVDLGEEAHAVDLVRGHGLEPGVLVRHRGCRGLAGGRRWQRSVSFLHPFSSLSGALPSGGGGARRWLKTAPAESGPSLGLLLLLFLVVVPQGLLEVADALADATTELGQAAGPEDEDDDDEEQDHLGEAEVEHDIPSRGIWPPDYEAAPGSYLVIARPPPGGPR